MFLDNSLLVNQNKFEGIEKDITCPICQGILNDPFFCIKCQNNFCNKCIKKWKENKSKCPFRCENPEYINNRYLNKILSELIKFKCQKGCDEIIPYKDINTHNENCKKEDFKEKYYEIATQLEILKVQIENYKDIKDELDETRERNNELENELEETKEERNNLEERVEELKGKIYDLEEEIEEEREDNNILRNQNKNLKNECDNLKSQFEKEQEQNKNLENKLKILEEEKIELEKNYKISEGKINELEKNNKKLVDQNISLNKEIKKLNFLKSSEENDKK